MSHDPEIRAEPDERPAAPRRSAAGLLLLLAGLVIAGVLFAWAWRSQQTAPEQAPVAVPAPVPVAPASAPTADTAPVVQYPMPAAADPALQAEEVPAALTDLVGAKAVSSFLQVDGFARRVVATIDSLGRAHSPSAAWPVFPTPGRFTVEERPDGPVLAADNASRYTPFVLLVGTLDVQKTAALYRRMYPLLQQAYRDLGFGDRYLNDRVVAVIDLLLATPEPETPPRLELTQVKGPVPSTQPWVRYQFADPALEGLAAGQKILVRVGPTNERRLKGKLAELRAQIVSGSALQGSASPAPAASAAAAPSSSAPEPGASTPR